MQNRYCFRESLGVAVGRDFMRKRMITSMLFIMTMVFMTACRASFAETGVETGEEETSVLEDESTPEEETEYKVAIVQYAERISCQQMVEAIREELDRKGELLGVTFQYEDYTYHGEADSERVDEIATDLLAEEVDLIIPVAVPNVRIFQDATEDYPIPVVFAAVPDPEGSGIVADMDAPGANITGVSNLSDTNAVFNLILTIDPEIKKIGLLYDMSREESLGAIEEAKTYCDNRGIEYVEKTGTTSDEIVLAAGEFIEEGCEAVFTPTDDTVLTAQMELYGTLIDAGIPQYTEDTSFVRNGAFLSFGTDDRTLGVMTADLAVDVLVHGADPAATPVKVPDERIITINTETAAAIGIDYSVLDGKADKFVEVQTMKDTE